MMELKTLDDLKRVLSRNWRFRFWLRWHRFWGWWRKCLAYVRYLIANAAYTMFGVASASGFREPPGGNGLWCRLRRRLYYWGLWGTVPSHLAELADFVDELNALIETVVLDDGE